MELLTHIVVCRSTKMMELGSKEIWPGPRLPVNFTGRVMNWIYWFDCEIISSWRMSSSWSGTTLWRIIYGVCGAWLGGTWSNRPGCSISWFILFLILLRSSHSSRLSFGQENDVIVDDWIRTDVHERCSILFRWFINQNKSVWKMWDCFSKTFMDLEPLVFGPEVKPEVNPFLDFRNPNSFIGSFSKE